MRLVRKIRIKRKQNSLAAIYEFGLWYQILIIKQNTLYPIKNTLQFCIRGSLITFFASLAYAHQSLMIKLLTNVYENWIALSVNLSPICGSFGEKSSFKTPKFTNDTRLIDVFATQQVFDAVWYSLSWNVQIAQVMTSSFKFWLNLYTGGKPL